MCTRDQVRMLTRAGGEEEGEAGQPMLNGDHLGGREVVLTHSVSCSYPFSWWMACFPCSLTHKPNLPSVIRGWL